jgi:hypothetical protein
MILKKEDGRAQPKDKLAGGSRNVLVKVGNDSVGVVSGSCFDRAETAGGVFLLLGSEGEEGKGALFSRGKHSNLGWKFSTIACEMRRRK